MASYRTKTVEIDAIQWDGTNYIDVLAFAGRAATVNPDGSLTIMAGAGSVWVKPGEWITLRADRHLDVHADDAFTARFDPA